MKILAIETSCDETSIAIIEKLEGADNLENKNLYKVLSHNTISQINIHAQYGGVYPMLARREHEKNLMPLLHKSLLDAGLLDNVELSQDENIINIEKKFESEITEFLERYPALRENILDFFNKFQVKNIDYIAVTSGPGLPPALWVGVNSAKVISKILGGIPIYPINHMEGHIIGGISENKNDVIEINKLAYSALSLLISGGHTELVLSEAINKYKKIGETLDDAVGESYDKVARMLGLEYPGGPKVGMLAAEGRELQANGINIHSFLPKSFPRPLLHSPDLNFSFSGLKTHILYLTNDLKEKYGELSDEMRMQIATEFEYTVRDVFMKKLEKAVYKNNIQTVIVGGGVASNNFLRSNFLQLADKLNIKIYISSKELSTDNALMIALTAAMHIDKDLPSTEINNFKAIGSMTF
jgi:N6-L-threonylcarbamoyladenine synthase